jgi:hypothetical protein
LHDTGIASQVVLAVGEERSFSLPSLAMAGYQWSGSVSGADPASVTLELRRGELPARTSPGFSAPEVAVIRGVRPGHALVHLRQCRSWEQAEPAADVLDVRIEVRASAMAHDRT